MRSAKLLFVFALIFAVKGQDDMDVCPPGEEFWPHEDCNRYYVCNVGLPIVQFCPGGLFWNQQEFYCDFPNNVPECVGGTRPPTGTTVNTPAPTTTTTTEPPTTTTTLPTTQPPPTTTPTTTVATTICPLGTPGTLCTPTTSTAPPTTTTPTTTRPPPPSCPPEGSHPIPYAPDCSMYIWCIDGAQTGYYRCPMQQLFDNVERKCLHADVAVCYGARW